MGDSTAPRQIEPTIDSRSIGKILVVKLRAIGDVLLSTVVLPNLRKAFPSAQIDFLAERSSADVLAGNPYLTSYQTFNPRTDSSLALLMSVRRRSYDLVFDLFGNPRSALITLASGAKHRVGYRFGWRRHCYTVVVEPRGGDVHNTQFNLDALRAVGIPAVEAPPFFSVDAEAKEFAARWIAEQRLEGRPVVALNPGGGWYTKRWKLEHFARLGDMISARDNAAVVIVWGPSEEEDARTIVRRMTRPALLAPPTGLKQLGALFTHCQMVVTNDSGPMHIAAALGIPVVAIFGPTRPELQGPVGAPYVIAARQQLVCLGCNLTTCPIGNPCMEELGPDEVYGSVQQLAQRIGVQTT